MRSADLVVDALAVARLTRMVTRDRIAQPLRVEWISESYERVGREVPEYVDMDEDAPAWATFITCPWCTSVWIGAAVVVARRIAPRLWGPVAVVLATSEIAGLAALADVE